MAEDKKEIILDDNTVLVSTCKLKNKKLLTLHEKIHSVVEEYHESDEVDYSNRHRLNLKQ